MDNTPAPADPNPPQGDAPQAQPQPPQQPAPEAKQPEETKVESTGEEVDVVSAEALEIEKKEESPSAPVSEEIPPTQTIEEAEEKAQTPEPHPEPTQTPTLENEVIQGSTSKPGDKVEDTPLPTKEEPQAPKETPPPAGNQPKDNFRKDGVTPLDGEEKIFAALGYIGILALLPLLARRDSEFAQHHGRQALVIAILLIVFWFVAKIGGRAFTSLAFALQVVAIIGGFIFAYQGKWFKVPGIYDLSLKLDFMNQTEVKQNPQAETTPPQQTENQSEATPTTEDNSLPPSQN